MGKNKLERFEYLHRCSIIYQNFDPLMPNLIHMEEDIGTLSGEWRKKHFKNYNPIILELACGGGEYTVNLAMQFPDKNFIGVDIKGARIWKGAKIAMKNSLDNVAFLRTRIEQICNFFGTDEVDEIWITFPDPFLRASKENKRLTSNPFLDMYNKILKKNGLIHLKTDDDTLYDFTMLTLQNREGANILYTNNDIYASPLKFETLAFKTYYEVSHLSIGRTIKYIQFTI
ncbi:MAG: tRNA (guanosine(46)-N7)-methyltransferase TrmB [Saprospiraceae bacterium]